MQTLRKETFLYTRMEFLTTSYCFYLNKHLFVVLHTTLSDITYETVKRQLLVRIGFLWHLKQCFSPSEKWVNNIKSTLVSSREEVNVFVSLATS